MSFDQFEQERRFHEAWEAVEIVRPVPFSLFTFGDSVLPYYLVCGDPEGTTPASLTTGQVRIQRPLILTPENADPDLDDFFETPEEEGVVQFLLARSVHFGNLKFANQNQAKRIVSDGVQATIAKLNRKLDDEEEEHTAILKAPHKLGRVAVLRYAAERVWQSGSDNVQELRERGFLP